MLGALAGRAFLQIIPWTRGDRLAEGTLTVALAYLAFIAAERLFHVSGVVAVLAAGMTVSGFGRTRIAPYNWSFLADLWEQIAFWAHSLVFLLASILVPRLLFDLRVHDLALLAALVVAVFAARLAVLFLLLPALSLAKLMQPISTAYKLAIAWGGLRGALTLVLALSVTENAALSYEVRRFVAVLATGLVLFTLLGNGMTLRAVIRLLRLDRPFARSPGCCATGCSNCPMPRRATSFERPRGSMICIRRRSSARSSPMRLEDAAAPATPPRRRN